MKKVLYIDFDGTLCVDRYWRSLPKNLHDALQNLLFKNNTEKVHAWMRGGYTAEEINRYAANHLDVSYEYLWNLFVDDCKTMKVSLATLEKIHTLRDKYTVVLVTGNMDSFTRFTAPALDLEKYFDYISNSYYERMHKTDNDGELFLKYFSKLDTCAENSILIDDSKECCNVFSSLGGKAYQVHSVDETLKVLEKLDIL